MVRVLTEPRNALVRQYKGLFGMEDSELEFTTGGLEAIARKAMAKNTGARGLRSIIEDVMLDIMYELPDQSAGSRYVITEEIVEGRDHLYRVADHKPKNKSA